MRAADTVMAMPAILLALVLVAAFGTSTLSMIVILGIIFAPATARIARSTLPAELRSEYYVAAVSVGASGSGSSRASCCRTPCPCSSRARASSSPR